MFPEWPVLLTSPDVLDIALPPPNAIATELESPETLLMVLTTGLAVAAPVSPELPPTPEVALLVALGLAVAAPVLPATPLELALELLALPEVALPLALALTSPDPPKSPPS